MRISFIVPTYNAAPTIGRALTSIITQAGDWEAEVIVVDDCSTDDTVLVAQGLASRASGVAIRQTPANGGPGVARNLGIEAATGDWICFLDSDDEIAPDALAKLARHAAEAGSAEGVPDVLAFDWRFAPPTPAQPPRPGEGREDLARLASDDRSGRIEGYLANRIDQSAIFHAYRRDFLLRHGIRFRGGYHEDVDFTFHALLLTNRVAPILDTIYLKWDRPGSIVNTLGSRHIHGYFDAIEGILDLLEAQGLAGHFSSGLAEFAVNVAASRLARVLRREVEKTEPVSALLSTLHGRIGQTFHRLGIDPTAAPARGSLATRYQQMFRHFLAAMPAAGTAEGLTALLDALAALQNKSWSCYDLHHSVFLAPDEIRTCCKRYYHDGKMKGDVVLLKGEGDTGLSFAYDAIRREKQRLVRDINRNQAPECEGCPFLAFADWGPPLAEGVKYLSLEYHSVCNMRCTYCSPIYYGGKQATYDVAAVVGSLAETKAFDQCEYIVWGGGEPTLDKSFPAIAKRLAEAAPRVRQRVISNCTRYTPQLADMMVRDQAFIVVSVDAGSQETFREIRQFRGFGRVIENIRRYHRASPENLLIKFIVMPENRRPEELAAFVARMAEAELLSSSFQVSCDFRSESLDTDEIAAVATLYTSLYERGARFVFIDDLVWQRLPAPSAETRAAVAQLLRAAGFADALAEITDFPEVAVWGTGAQARLLMEKSAFLRETAVAHFVDPRPQAIGSRFLDRPVHSPRSLLDGQLPVVIAAVQSAPFIYRSIAELGIGTDRVIRKLIL